MAGQVTEGAEKSGWDRVAGGGREWVCSASAAGISCVVSAARETAALVPG